MAGLIPYRRTNPCPECGHGDGWCYASADARYTFCRRVQGARAIVREDVRGQEYYLTRNDGAAEGIDDTAPAPPHPAWRETAADADTRDRVYRALLSRLGLSGEHTRHLRQRGLPGSVIERNGYATLPAAEGERNAVVRELVQSIGALYLLDVPGFYKRNGSKGTRLAGAPGILIPVRDELGRVVACLIRIDEARDGGGKYRWLSAPPDTIGCGPGLCLHIPLHESGNRSVVRITEGPLKADVATALSGVLTLGLAGVGAWKLALPTLQAFKPSKVLVAFDVDARTNPHVARPLSRITQTLQNEGYTTALEVWPASAGKGIDDVLAASQARAIRTIEQDGISAELRAIETSAGVNAIDPPNRPSKPHTSGNPDERKSQAKALLELAAGVECFHSPEGQMFADVQVDGRRQTWPIGSASFRQWLALRMYRTHDKPAGAQAMNDALAVLEARARFDGQERTVFLRVGQVDNTVYVDLANDGWEVVEITRQGWRIVTEPNVRFRRTNGMRSLPRPVEGGRLDALRPFLNMESDDDWTLTVAWLLGALRARGPYPLMVLQGEQGAAKSTTARVLRELIDPNTSPLRAKPRDVQELMIAAINGWVICYDNLSGLPADLSDGLCRLATGGGFSTRELYSDTSEVLLEAQRPAILTGIDAITTRADLADRSLILTLPPIPEAKRKREADFWSSFEAARPRILGALFTAISGALGNSGKSGLTTLPRMADFAEWVASAETTLGWRSGTFIEAYSRNRGDVAVGTVEADPVAVAVRRLVQEHGEWEGSATQLLQVLGELAGESVTRGRSWPRGPRQVSEHLFRAAPALRTSGIDVVRDRKHRGRLLTLRRVEAAVSSGSGDAPPLCDDEHEPSVTEIPEQFHGRDAGDAGDPLPSVAKGNRTEVSDFERVLTNPIVAEAIKELEPEAIRVRLPDGRVWTAQPDGAPQDPSPDRPKSGDSFNHQPNGKHHDHPR